MIQAVYFCDVIMEQKQKLLSFDFDRWSSMAKQDPERFEQMREQLLGQMIEQSPDSIKHRMQGLQWQIDQIRNQSPTPMASCLKISTMMWNSLLGERGLLTALETPDRILNQGMEADENKVVHLNSPDNPGEKS